MARPVSIIELTTQESQELHRPGAGEYDNATRPSAGEDHTPASAGDETARCGRSTGREHRLLTSGRRDLSGKDLKGCGTNGDGGDGGRYRWRRWNR